VSEMRQTKDFGDGDGRVNDVIITCSSSQCFTG
jgi:hypothetical protein